MEADVASIPPVVRRKVLVFLHMYSGHRRENDLEDWLSKLGCEAGVYVMVICADLGYGNHWDLTKKGNLQALKARADAGEFHGKHGGPPSSTWSAARYILPRDPEDPRPLREAAQPWGLPGLKASELRALRLGSQLLRSSLLRTRQG